MGKEARWSHLIARLCCQMKIKVLWSDLDGNYHTWIFILKYCSAFSNSWFKDFMCVRTFICMLVCMHVCVVCMWVGVGVHACVSGISRNMWTWMHWFARAIITKPQTKWIILRNLFSFDSGGWKTKNKVLVRLFLLSGGRNGLHPSSACVCVLIFYDDSQIESKPIFVTWL